LLLTSERDNCTSRVEELKCRSSRTVAIAVARLFRGGDSLLQWTEPPPLKRRATAIAFITLVGNCDLRALLFGGRRNRLEGSAPAAFAHLIGIDEIVGILSALLAFEGDGPRHAAHIQSAREGLPLDPLHKFHGHVAIVIRMGFFERKEEGSGTKQ
jgi:hypothetical protein